MKLKLVSSMLLLSFVTSVYSFDTKRLENNKELVSRQYNIVDLKLAKHRLLSSNPGQILSRENLYRILDDSFRSFQKNEQMCELGLLDNLTAQLGKNGFSTEPEAIIDFLIVLRSENLIDDVLFEIIENSIDIGEAYKAVDKGEIKPLLERPLIKKESLKTKYELEKIFSQFEPFPDEKNQCSTARFINLTSLIKQNNNIKADLELKRIIYLAYEAKFISKNTFLKLEQLRLYEVNKWTLGISQFMDIVENAKDLNHKTTLENVEINQTNKFSTKYVKRRDLLTRRDRLYGRFNSTQIVMLANILEKSAHRRDASKAYLTFDFDENQKGEEEIYVLSPMEQYRVSLKMLRKDMAELKRSEIFANTSFDYDDVISAGLETGTINYDQLKYVIEFEELWNPKSPQWKTYLSYVFSFASTATFYLPPPYNVIGAIGLVFIQTKIYKSQNKARPEDNWNAIL